MWKCISYIIGYFKILKSGVVHSNYAQQELCVINEVDNESAPDLERFSDHDPDLFFNQQNFSDRTVYDMYGF